MKKIGLLTLILFLCACEGFSPKVEIYNPEYTPEISVFAVVSTDENSEFVIVERTMRINEKDEWTKPGDPSLIIDNAIVKIISETDTVQFTFYRKSTQQPYDADQYWYRGMYLDLNDEFKAHAGNTYKLLVQVPDGRTVTATTIVPECPKIIQPLSNTLLKKETIKETIIRWNENSQTAAYLINFFVETKPTYYEGEYYPAHRFNIINEELVYDSPATFEEIDYFFLHAPKARFSDITTIKITAMDRDLYDYTLKNNMAALTGVQFNLVEGSVGVFGSLSVDSVNVVWQ